MESGILKSEDSAIVRSKCPNQVISCPDILLIEIQIEKKTPLVIFNQLSRRTLFSKDNWNLKETFLLSFLIGAVT